jgi:hypothetical protein
MRQFEDHYVPFSLGYPGEKWDETFPCLWIPGGRYGFVRVTKYSDRVHKFAMVLGAPGNASYLNEWYYFEDMLMLASAVALHLEEYREKTDMAGPDQGVVEGG